MGVMLFFINMNGGKYEIVVMKLGLELLEDIIEVIS